jgi:DnaK suppressor protein
MGLSKAEIEKYRKKLLELKKQLAETLAGTSQEVKTPDSATGYSQHQADQGTDEFDRSITLEVTGQELSIMKQIDHALERMDEGLYGVCEVTGDPIPKARLDAMPYATKTVKAQAQLEEGSF